MWGCKTEAKIPNALTQKFDLKIISCHFIGYYEKSKGYKFYAPHNFTRTFETNQAKFLDEVSCNTNFEDLFTKFE